MAIVFRHRRGTVSENNAFTGAAGEVVVDTTNNRIRVHDGTTQGGFPVGDSINVLDYGAAADGITNDSEAIKNAAEAANGGILDLNGGTYLLTTSIYINVPDGITFVNGILNYDFTTQGEMGIRITSSKDVRVSNVTVNGNNTVAKLFYIRASGTSCNVYVDNFHGYNALQTNTTGLAAALYCTEETSSDFFNSVHIVNSKFTDVDSNGGSLVGRGALIQSSSNTLVTNCHFENIGPYNDGDGIFVTDASVFGTLRFVLSNCTFIDCQKRAIKSQVAKTRISNVVTRRRSAFAAAPGQCEVDLQSGGVVDGVSCYYDSNCAPTTIINSIMRTNNEPLHIKNISIVAENPNDVVNIIGTAQQDDVYSLDTVIENIYGNCTVQYFLSISGEGYTTDPGSPSAYLFDNLIIRNVRFPNFMTSPETDAISGQLKYGLINLSRSATAYINVRFSAYNIHIGDDDTVPTTYLDTNVGSLVYVKAELVKWFDCKGFDTSTYDGTGTSTYTKTPIKEYLPAIQVSDLTDAIQGGRVNISENSTYSKTYTLNFEQMCKVTLTYGSRNLAGTRLYTEGIIINGGGVNEYFETIAGNKTSTNTGTISISVSGNEFTISKTAGSTSDSGVLTCIIQHLGTVS